MSADIIIVNLSPIETECAVCDGYIIDGNKGIAMFESEPVPHDWPGEWGGFPCCESCFAEFERVQAHQGERRVWFAAKRREARLRQQPKPCFVGDL
jgi:hypothetical protein